MTRRPEAATVPPGGCHGGAVRNTCSEPFAPTLRVSGARLLLVLGIAGWDVATRKRRRRRDSEPSPALAVAPAPANGAGLDVRATSDSSYSSRGQPCRVTG